MTVPKVIFFQILMDDLGRSWTIIEDRRLKQSRNVFGMVTQGGRD